MFLLGKRTAPALLAAAIIASGCLLGGSPATAAPRADAKVPMTTKINLYQYQLKKKASNGKALCLSALKTSAALTVEYCNSSDARQLWFYTEYNGYGVQANYNWSTYPSTLWGSKTPSLASGSKVGLSRPNGTITTDWSFNPTGASPLIYNRSSPQVVFDVETFSAGSNVYLAQASSGGSPNVSWSETNTGTFTP